MSNSSRKPPNFFVNACTIKHDRKFRAIFTNIRTSEFVAEQEALKGLVPNLKEYAALWDTGASGSVISSKIVRELSLKPVSKAKTLGVGGEMETEIYYINFYLPNGVSILGISALRGELINFDVLVGMDVISNGDFAITNHLSKTVMSFRMPSCYEIDWAKEHTITNTLFQRKTRNTSKNSK